MTAVKERKQRFRYRCGHVLDDKHREYPASYAGPQITFLMESDCPWCDRLRDLRPEAAK